MKKVLAVSGVFVLLFAKIALAEPYGNTKVVAVSGGDYTDPSVAMDDTSWTNNCTSTSPCLLKIMPGVYTVSTPVYMHSYIDIEGSGENVTVIGTFRASRSLSTGTVVASGVVGNCQLRFLTVENNGSAPPHTSNPFRAAIYTCSGAVVSMLHVTASAQGSGGNNYGFAGSSSGLTNMTFVTANATNGTETNCAIAAYGSPLTLTNVTATATGSSTAQYGIYDKSSTVTMSSVTANVSGGAVAASNNYGVYIDTGGTVTMNNVNVTATGTRNVYGIYNNQCTSTMTNDTVNVSGTSPNNDDYITGIYMNSSTVDMTAVKVSACTTTCKPIVTGIVTSKTTPQVRFCSAIGYTESGVVQCAFGWRGYSPTSLDAYNFFLNSGWLKTPSCDQITDPQGEGRPSAIH